MSRGQSRLEVAETLAEARSLPGWFYNDPEAYKVLLERVLARTWHLVELDGHGGLAGDPGLGAWPGWLLPGSLEEPVLMARHEDGTSRLLSNVCTHRGRVLLEAACESPSIRCAYHGRRFDLRGCVRGSPGFEGEAAPGGDEDLPEIPTGTWGPIRFAAIEPHQPVDQWLAPLRSRLEHLPLQSLTPVPAGSRDYEVNANWALYCDNYLEGLHIPFVHPALGQQLDWSSYRVETFPWGSLQVGVAAEGTPTLELPGGHPDAGSRVAALYFWLFPATMVNVYPWGISVNAVQPLGLHRTRVCFRAFTWCDGDSVGGAGGDLDTVELEDEQVVEAVQRGVRSRMFRPGRYAPRHEVAVHHFHRLLARLWNEPECG
ncbi:MAG: choline monooxygenase [Deltaproteobacteria bacterium]|nr:choline monooxygenase [Deltaproteobacteria bacterium]